MPTPRFRCSMASSMWPLLYAAMPSRRAFSASAERYSGSRDCEAGPSPAGREPRHRVEQARDAERLLEVLLDAVVLLQVLGDAPAAVDGAHHDDRDAAVLGAPLDAARDVEAVKLGQHRVEDDEVGHVLLDQAQRQQPAVGLEHAVALAGQEALDELADLLFVVDDQDELARARRRPRPRPPPRACEARRASVLTLDTSSPMTPNSLVETSEVSTLSSNTTAGSGARGTGSGAVAAVGAVGASPGSGKPSWRSVSAGTCGPR